MPFHCPRIVLNAALIGGSLFSANSIAQSNVHQYTKSALQCYQSYAATKYKEAVEACSQAALSSDPQSQYLLAVMYIYGVGVEANVITALSLLTEAAAQGHIKAAHNLGAAYDIGRGVDVNYQEARKWYEIAAKAGMPEAQQNLASMYELGKGVDVNYEEAFLWYSSAAEQGYADAQYKVGLMYQQGKGTKQDLEKAESRLQLAAWSGHADAQLAYGLMAMTKTPAKAVFWLERAGHRGLNQAYYQLARMFSQSEKLADMQRAFSYAERAVFDGHIEALTLRDRILSKIRRAGGAVPHANNADEIDEAQVGGDTISTQDSNASVKRDKIQTGENYKDNNWLLSQPPNAYTLQLKHSASKKEIEGYIRNHDLGKHASYYATLREAGMVYVLVFGRFDQIATARAAVETLPDRVQAAQPWVRRFKDLQRKYRDPS